MKKLLFLIAPALLLLAGCQYDDANVWRELERQKGLITELTQRVENLNSEVQNFKTLIGNLQKDVYVKKVQKNADGYLISFSDGSSITVKDGAPGAPGAPGETPVVGVKADEDGIYYWTLNGEWILDASGNKMRVAGDDGTDGVTPVLKYEDPDWMVSYDNGENWEAIPGAQGIGTGITVTTDEENAYFTLADGTVITIPLVAAAVKLQLVFDETAIAVIAPGETASVDYEIVAPEGTKAVIETFEQTGWVVEVTAKTETTGTITITAPAAYEAGKVLFCLRTDDGQSFVKIVKIEAEAKNPLEAEYVLDATAGDILIPVAATAATLSDGADWVTATVGEDGVTLTVTENDTYEERSATLTVTTDKGSYETVVKQLQNNAIVLTGSYMELPGEAGEVEIPVKANVEYTASVTEGSEWITELTTKALVEKVWTAAIAANEGAVRTGKITFTDGTISQVVEIAQASATPQVMTVDLPEGLDVRNTYPVFTKDGSKAYFVTRGTRSIIQISMNTGKILWTKELGGKADNGGCLMVNPFTDDVICANETKVFAITSAGEIKWEFAIDQSRTKSNCSSTIGCGPTISNDGSVILAACQDYMLYAINAETGAKVADYEFETEGTLLQYAVYGDNYIAIQAQGGNQPKKGIRILQFKDNALTEVKVRPDIGIGLSDITCPVVDKDQAFMYTFGGGNFNRFFLSVEGAANDIGFNLLGTGANNSWNGVIAPDGKIYFATQKPCTIVQADPAKVPASDALKTMSFSAGENELNFHPIACDENSNIYFYHNAAHAVKMLNTAEDKVETVYTLDASIANYQTVFNYVGNKVVFGFTTIYIVPVETKRAKGWSGAGGDICATRNANLIWAD